MLIKFKKLVPEAKEPIIKNPTDFCYDIYCTSVEKLNDNLYQYHTGLAMQIDRASTDEFCKKCNILYNEFPVKLDIDIRPRSGIFKMGLSMANSIATIDEQYTGELLINMYKLFPWSKLYEPGDRIAQICVSFTVPLTFQEVPELTKTTRGNNGLGHSGLK